MKKILILFGLTLAVLSTKAQDTMAKPDQAVVDKANLLAPDQENAIAGIISNLANSRGTNAYLLIVDSLPAGQNLIAFTKGIFKKWDLNNGNDGQNFIMIYSKRDHGVRVEASDKTLQILTKDYIQEVIANSIKPFLKQRKDYEGLKRGMEMLAKKIENN